MKELLLVGVGSFLGGMGRYYLSGCILQSYSVPRFPLGTLTVNFIGCLIIGIVAGSTGQDQHSSQLLRLFLMTGVLGGFTTFSAFGYETVSLIRTDNLGLALANVMLSVATCLIAVWIGLKITGA